MLPAGALVTLMLPRTTDVVTPANVMVLRRTVDCVCVFRAVVVAVVLVRVALDCVFRVFAVLDCADADVVVWRLLVLVAAVVLAVDCWLVVLLACC